MTSPQLSARTAARSARDVAASDLSPDELAAYEPLLPALARELTASEKVRRIAVHGSELLAFTEERLVAVRRRLFDYRVRWPRYRSIAYRNITEIRVETNGESAKTLVFSLAGQRRVIRFFFPGAEADRIAALVAACLER